MNKLSTYILDEHETLGVGDDLGGVERLLKVVDDGLAVAREVGARALELGGSTDALLLERRQATSKDGLADQSDGHTKVKGVDGGPLAGTLLASRVEDLLEHGSSIVVVEVHDVAGDFDEERVEDALVPLGEDVANLLVVHAKTALHDVVGLE